MYRGIKDLLVETLDWLKDRYLTCYTGKVNWDKVLYDLSILWLVCVTLGFTGWLIYFGVLLVGVKTFLTTIGTILFYIITALAVLYIGSYRG